ncbi:MAG: SDR family NAD(P)-dependent oxidoreductase [Spirochaetaceae bacterium]|nr:SDR family NAD(P)-dependent oxidoreductase [Spirochaetaceae bacterium]
MGLADKVCIVTGGGSGIGRAAALLMAAQGARVAVVGRTESKLTAVRGAIERQGGTALALSLDVADHAAVRRMAAEVLDTWGRVDVLVNNAGHSSAHRMLLTTTPEDIRSTIDSNLAGTIYCTQAVMPAMQAAGAGTIINVASLAGVGGSLLGGPSYSAAKAGVINFTQYLNSEFRNSGLRASVIIPGEVDTPIVKQRPVHPSPEARATMATSEDVARAILLVADLPQRTLIPELTIRPTYLRDTSAEVGVK